jgi:hypothetical protein
MYSKSLLHIKDANIEQKDRDINSPENLVSYKCNFEREYYWPILLERQRDGIQSTIKLTSETNQGENNK